MTSELDAKIFVSIIRLEHIQALQVLQCVIELILSPQRDKMEPYITHVQPASAILTQHLQEPIDQDVQ